MGSLEARGAIRASFGHGGGVLARRQGRKERHHGSASVPYPADSAADDVRRLLGLRNEIERRCRNCQHEQYLLDQLHVGHSLLFKSFPEGAHPIGHHKNTMKI